MRRIMYCLNILKDDARKIYNIKYGCVLRENEDVKVSDVSILFHWK